MKYYIVYYYENCVNYYSNCYTYFFITCCPKNTLICKLDLIYGYIVYNEKPVYGHFTHILQKQKLYIKSFCYNIVENHLYTKFGKKKNILKT